MGVDVEGFYPRGGPGRPSVRVISKNDYTHGLFLLDLEHAPIGCGTWPAYWTIGPNWPNNGEIDIIEGVNLNTVNSMTLHSSEECTIAGTGCTGTLQGNDCAYYPGDNYGCGITSPVGSPAYGAGLNENGGGT